jgi:hypothetical protein
MKGSGINMKKLYNIKIIKKVTPESLNNQDIHFTWANVINGSELYATKGNNSVNILFKRRKEIISLDVTKEFAQEHFQIIGDGATNQEGVEISKYINQENNLR